MFPVIAGSKSTLLVKKFSDRLTFLCRVPRAKALALPVNDFKYGNPHGHPLKGLSRKKTLPHEKKWFFS
jgi:hypothetical protein